VLNTACNTPSEFRSILLLRSLEGIKRYVFDSRVLMAAVDTIIAMGKTTGCHGRKTETITIPQQKPG